MSKLLLTGYPGWLTRRFLETLPEYPRFFDSIKCLVHPQWSGLSAPAGIKTVSGDLADRESLARAAAGCDFVLHTAALIHVRRIREFYEVNRDGTRRLLEACAGAGVKRFVFISSNAAQGFSRHPDHVLTETDPCRPESHYGKSKREAEKIVESFGTRGPMQTVILRPAMFYGPPVPERHVRVFKTVLGGVFPVFGSGENRRSVTYIDHLVQAVHLAFRVAAAAGQTYTIIDREIPTLNQLIDAMGEALGRKARVLRLPVWLAEAAWKFDEFYSALGAYWMLPHITGESHRSIVYSVEKAQRELGYKPVVNYREGYRRAADWCRAQRLL